MDRRCLAGPGHLSRGRIYHRRPCCNNVNDRGQIFGFSIDSSFNLRALLWQSKDQAPVDLNTLIPADSPWHLLYPGGITNSGEIAATAVNLNTFELHAVVVSPIAGVGPATRGAKNRQPCRITWLSAFKAACAIEIKPRSETEFRSGLGW